MLSVKVGGLHCWFEPGTGTGGTPLLLVHGQLNAADGIAVVGERLRARGDGRPFAAIDLPWHGESDRPDDEDATRLGRSVREVLSILGWSEAFAVGHSLGAHALIDAMLDGESPLRRTLLVGCPADWSEATVAEFHGFAALLDAQGVVPELIPIAADRWYGEPHRKRTPDIYDRVGAVLRGNDPRAAARVFRGMLQLPAREPRLSTLAGRVAFATGVLDPIAPPADVARLAHLAGDAPHDVIDDAGHFPFEEAPAAFDDVLDRFLAT